MPAPKYLWKNFLTGIELSVFVLTDGRDYVMCFPKQKITSESEKEIPGPTPEAWARYHPLAFADAEFLRKGRRACDETDHTMV
jgi:phosphoribosylamine---glycine ligase